MADGLNEYGVGVVHALDNFVDLMDEDWEHLNGDLAADLKPYRQGMNEVRDRWIDRCDEPPSLWPEDYE